MEHIILISQGLVLDIQTEYITITCQIWVIYYQKAGGQQLKVII